MSEPGRSSDRDLERGQVSPLRRGDRRGAPRERCCVRATGSRHRPHRRRLRPGRGRRAARPGADRGPARGLLAGRRGRPRLLRGRARRAARLPALHRPGAARARRLRRVPADGGRAQPRAARRAPRSTFSSSTTRTGSATRARRSGTGWRRCARRASTAQIGVAPGPANGFTLDLISCFERFGERIDWAMIILNPFEPWPGELCLEAAARHDVRVITRVVDYGGLFWGDIEAGDGAGRGRSPRVPSRRLDRGRPRRSSRGWSRSPSARS